jgi:hypothetical protein
VLALVALVVGLGLLLSAPLTGWIGKLPETIPRVQQKLSFLGGTIRSLERALEHVQNLAPTGGNGARQVAVQTTSLAAWLLAGIRTLAGGAFTTLLVLFFVLVSGETFLRRLVELMPRFKDKKQLVDISQQIEADISVYLATITMMNTLVGIATGAMAWLCGLGDPLLWGTFAFLLNYVPILGPTAGVLIFLVAVGDARSAMDSPGAGRPLSLDPHRRGRDGHADAAGQPVHGEPGADHPRRHLLVLDVGGVRRHSRDAAVGDDQDRLRPDRAVPPGGPFHRRLNQKGRPFGAAFRRKPTALRPRRCLVRHGPPPRQGSWSQQR